MRIALDSNVLVHAEGVDGERRQTAARATITALRGHDLIIPAQCLGELFRVLTGKAGWSSQQAAGAVFTWRHLARIAPTQEATVAAAIELIGLHPHQIWDAIIIIAAAEAGCEVLLSEDMRDGFVYRGVTVANPFAERLHPLLASMLDPLPQDPPAGAPK